MPKELAKQSRLKNQYLSHHQVTNNRENNHFLGENNNNKAFVVHIAKIHTPVMSSRLNKTLEN